MTNLPMQALTNFDIESIASSYNIPHFRGVFMRDTLPAKPENCECLVLNWDLNKNDGTHWSCIYINPEHPDNRIYFDSYGFDAPQEVHSYLQHYKWSTFQLQNYNDYICGHLCMYVLILLSNGQTFENIIFSLLNYI
jgi:hypothetical protein